MQETKRLVCGPCKHLVRRPQINGDVEFLCAKTTCKRFITRLIKSELIQVKHAISKPIIKTPHWCTETLKYGDNSAS